MRAELSIGVSAIRASQVGLDAVGQNLANANTPGYHRQVVHQVDRYPNELGGLYIGNGVEVEGIFHIRNTVIEQSLVQNQSQTSLSQTRLDMARRIEALLIPGDGALPDRLNDFFAAFESLSSDPGERVRRDGVIGTAVGLTQSLQTMSNDLHDVSNEIRLQARDIVARINDLSLEIADLNHRIHQAQLVNAQPNDLIDRRDLRVTELSELVDVDLNEFENYVTIAGGPTIFRGSNIPQFEVQLDGQQLVIQEIDGGPLSPSGGQLAALLDTHNETLPALRDTLDGITRGLIATVDRQHVQGVGLNGSFSVLSNQRPIDDFAAPLDTLDTVLPITAGPLYVTITDEATGARQRHTIQIDPATDSVNTVAAALDGLANLNATVNPIAESLTIRAARGYAFDFATALPVTPDTAALTGTASPEIGGEYFGEHNGALSFRFLSSGTVGVTPDLGIEVTNADGDVVGQLDVGLGYQVDSPLELPDGMHLSLGAGTVVAGETFGIPTVADADASGFLTAFGFNTFFTGSSASTLAVQQELRENSDLLATSSNGDVEDATNLNRIVERRLALTTDAAQLTVEQFTQRFVADLGRQVQEHDEASSHLELVKENLRRQQAATSGVDPNEELVHMLQFQRSFQTAARYITVISEVTAELMQILG